MKKISEIRTPDVVLATPDQSICDAAGMMARADIGSLPVGEDDRLVGMITDRDIVLRAVAQGRDALTPVREVMTSKIQYCFEDEDVDSVAKNMVKLGVRRLPVLNRGRLLVGIVALSNIAHANEAKATEKLLEVVAEPH